MTDIQLYAGLAPVLLGLFAIVFAHVELRDVRRRKAKPQPIPTFDDGVLAQRVIAPALPMVFATLTVAVVVGFVMSYLDVPGYLMSRGRDTVAISFKEAIGTDIFDGDNRKIGEVTDFQLTSRGKEAKVVVGKTSPDKSDKTVVVPVDSLVWQRIPGFADHDDDSHRDDSYRAIAKNGLAQKPAIN